MIDQRIGQQRVWRRNRNIVLITIALVRGGYTMVVPFMPIYLQELGVSSLAANAAWSGVIISIAPFLAALAGPAWGAVADRFGLKLMAQRALLFFVVSWLVMGYADEISHLVLARVIAGLLGGYMSLSIPMVVAGCPKELLAKAMGSVQSTRIASTALGPLVGGFLADLIGIRSTALLAALFHVVAFVLVALLFKELEPASSEGKSRPRVKMRALVAQPALRVYFAILFLASFVERGLNPLIALVVMDLGTPVKEAGGISGLILGVAAIAATISAWWLGRLATDRNPGSLLLWTAVGSFVVSLPLAFSASIFQLGLFRILLGLGVGGILTLTFLLGNASIPASSRASGLSILSSGALLGNAAGPMLVGLLASYGLRWGLSLGIPVFLMLIWLAWRPQPAGEGEV